MTMWFGVRVIVNPPFQLCFFICKIIEEKDNNVLQFSAILFFFFSEETFFFVCTLIQFLLK